MHRLKKILLILLMLFLRNFYVLAQQTRDTSALQIRESVLSNPTDTMQEVSFERGTVFSFPNSNGRYQSLVLDSMWNGKENKCSNCLTRKNDNVYVVHLNPKEKGFKVNIQYICRNPGFQAPNGVPKPTGKTTDQVSKPTENIWDRVKNVRNNINRSEAILGIKAIAIPKPTNIPDFAIYREVLKQYITSRIGCFTILNMGVSDNDRFFPTDPTLLTKKINIKVVVGSDRPTVIQMSNIQLREFNTTEGDVINVSADMECKEYKGEYLNKNCEDVKNEEIKQKKQYTK